MMWMDGDKKMLILESEKKLTDEGREAIEKRVEEKTGYACVIIDQGVKLVAEISPGELCEK